MLSKYTMTIIITKIENKTKISNALLLWQYNINKSHYDNDEFIDNGNKKLQIILFNNKFNNVYYID